MNSSVIVFLLFFLAEHTSAQGVPSFFNEAYLNELWYQKALVNKGDSERVKYVMSKAKKGLAVTIGMIGGSITAGAGSSDSDKSAYAPLIIKWWKNKFPESEIKFINVGVGATNSIFGVHRIDSDLIKYKPDLVFVEFSVNDRDEVHAMEAYEGLVRKVLCSFAKPAVIAIATMGDKGDNWQDQHLPICKHYQVPMVSYRDAIWPEILNGKMKWSDISSDDVHPNDRGHSYIAGLVCHYFDQVYNRIGQISILNTQLPKALTFNGYEKSTIFSSASIPGQTGWEMDEGCIKARKNGEPLILTVKGGYVSIMFTKTPQSWGGKAYVIVDGEKRIDMDADFSGGWGTYQKNISLLHEENKRKHTLAFYFDDERPGKEFNIYKILIANY